MSSHRAEMVLERKVCGDEVPADPARPESGLTHVCGEAPGHGLPHSCYECNESWGTPGANFTSWQHREQAKTREIMYAALMSVASSWWPSSARATARNAIREYFRYGFISPEPQWLKYQERIKAPSGIERA